MNFVDQRGNKVEVLPTNLVVSVYEDEDKDEIKPTSQLRSPDESCRDILLLRLHVLSYFIHHGYTDLASALKDTVEQLNTLDVLSIDEYEMLTKL